MNKQRVTDLASGVDELNGSAMRPQYGQLYAGMVMLPTLILCCIFVQKRLTEGMTAGGSKNKPSPDNGFR